FVASRRRHTSCYRDWSSDVCSSDLFAAGTSLLRATLFDTKTRDQLGYDAVTFQTINIDRTSNRGLELSASGHVAETDLNASLTQIGRAAGRERGESRLCGGIRQIEK